MGGTDRVVRARTQLLTAVILENFHELAAGDVNSTVPVEKLNEFVEMWTELDPEAKARPQPHPRTYPKTGGSASGLGAASYPRCPPHRAPRSRRLHPLV